MDIYYVIEAGPGPTIIDGRFEVQNETELSAMVRLLNENMTVVRLLVDGERMSEEWLLRRDPGVWSPELRARWGA